MENLVNELYAQASRQTLKRTSATTLELGNIFKGTCCATKQALFGRRKSFPVDKWFHLENFLLHLAKHTQQPHNFSFSSSFDILWEKRKTWFSFLLPLAIFLRLDERLCQDEGNETFHVPRGKWRTRFGEIKFFKKKELRDKRFS